MNKPVDHLKITELLHRRDRSVAGATPFCPSGQELAAAFHGATDQASRDAFERHLVQCAHCRARLGVVAQALQEHESIAVPDELLQQAIALGQRPPRRHVHRLPVVAAVALAVITVLFVQNPGRVPELPNPDAGSTAPPRPQRNIEKLTTGPAILAPADGSAVQLHDLQVRWTPVPGTLYYDIRLLDAAGFIVWEDRLTDTSSTIPEELPLVPGERYFVRVDAYLAEAKSVGSRHVTFTVRAGTP